MGETDAERRAGEARMAPRPARVLANLAYYGALFLMVVGFLGVVAWNRISRVEVLSAHVATAASQIIAPVAGYVRELTVPAGSKVAEGEVIVRLDDQEALRLLGEAEVAQVEAAQALAAAEARLAEHLSRRDEARAAFRGGAERFDQGQTVNPGDYHDIRQRLEADLDLARREDERLAGRVISLRERAEATALTAPAPGTVMEHFVRPFDMVRAGDPLTLFEPDAPRSILAHLPASSVLKVWTGMRADVTYMADARAVALVGEVRRLTVDGRGTEQVLVASISVPGLSVEDSRRLFREGMPVSVVLRPEHVTRWVQGWWP
jgi:multidrug resistance efflux pump